MGDARHSTDLEPVPAGAGAPPSLRPAEAATDSGGGFGWEAVAHRHHRRTTDR